MKHSCLLILFAFLVFPAGAHSQERLALLIGNSRYDEAPPLRNPENDIDLVEEALSKVGFATTKRKNLDLSTTKTEIEKFLDAVSREDDPIVVVYFAGHGVQFGGRNYLLPTNVKTRDKEDVASGSLEVSELIKKLSAATSGVKLIVLDACRDDPFEKSRGLDRGLASLRSDVQAPRPGDQGTIIAYSTKPGAVAVDGSTGFSPYAAAFAEAVLMPRSEVEDAFKRVRRTVQERTSGAQTPWEEGGMVGSFRFVDRLDAAEPDDREVSFWEIASIANTPESMQRYLNEYHSGIFASLARQKIEAMNKDFSFTRKNEVFPVFLIDDSMVNLCRNREYPGYNAAPNQIDLFKLGTKYHQSIIYLRVTITLENLQCRNVIYSIIQMTDGYSSSQIAESKSLSAYVSGTNFILELPEPRDHQTFDPCEALCLYFEGLVRVEYEGEEESFAVSFAAVDPAEYGLTYKWENTKSRLDHLLNEAASQADVGQSGRKLSVRLANLDEISSYWTHNGSLMGLVRSGDERQIVYVRPRDELEAIGIEPGVILFEGESSDGVTYQGESRTFSQVCGSEPYEVAGRVSSGNDRIDLYGSAPQFDSACVQAGSRDDHLIFSRER